MTLSATCADKQASIIPSRYTGKERDSESGNDYFGARYYASTMGRFMNPDPSQLYFANPTNPQSFNLYSYAWNNPLSNVDPSGMECVWDDGSYDAADDPDTGSADQCSAAGGTWVDPNLFESVEGNQYGSWSGDASSSVAFDWLTPSAIVGADSSVIGSICSAIPTAGVQGVSGAIGFLGAPTGSLELVTNYRSGQVSGFAAGGISVGWNNGVLSAAGYSGGVWGLNANNSNYSGGFTSGTLSVSTPVPFVGVQATASSSSGGLTGTPRQMIPNGQVNSVTFGVNAALRAPSVSVTAAATNYSNPVQLGEYWTALINPIDALGFAANQVCSALGH